MESSDTKKAIIRLKPSKTEEVSVLASGEYFRMGNTWNINFSYDSADFAVGLSEDVITISRIAEDSYTLYLEKGKTHEMVMKTRFGDIVYMVKPVEMEVNETEKGIEAFFKYFIKPSQSGSVSMYISCEDDE